MKNNPVQVVLNLKDYIAIPDVNPGGENTDFFAGNDNLFAAHKQRVLLSVQSIKRNLLNSSSPSIFAHVTLRPEAIAKSHRPIRAIFPTNKVEYIGGGKFGEMLVELNEKNIDHVVSAIVKAETETTLIEKDGKIKAKPSRQKSELGAINEIREHAVEDKRKFSVETGYDWLQDSRTGGVYYVEIFYDIRREQENSKFSNLSKMGKDFEERLFALDNTLEVLRSKWKGLFFYIIKVKNQDDFNAHKKLITFLDNEPIVKKIHLPPILKETEAETVRINQHHPISPPQEGVSYPIVGIVDSGVQKDLSIEGWRAGEVGFIEDELQDRSHGTFIAGLISAGAELNSKLPFLRERPCKFYDLDLFATNSENFKHVFPNGFHDFLTQLEFEIPKAKEIGTRIFNMSLSLDMSVESESYGFFASLLDEISDNHDVVFILTAGNLEAAEAREPWPLKPNDALAMLAKYRHQGSDRVLQPCESIRSLTVGALDPAHNVDELKPSSYTRRGPGPALGVKPDLTHIGGILDHDSGIYSIHTSGELISGCGTSYAAPLVAKTLAILDFAIEGSVPRETLIALLIHGAKIPGCMDSKDLVPIARDFVGFGMPSTSDESILHDDYSINLIFHGELKNRQELSFDFSWPDSLITEKGGCRGDVTLTLVYSPDCSYKFGTEFIRTNVDVYLRQAEVDKKTGEIKYKGRLTSDTGKSYEKSMIENGLKWWPIKKFHASFRSKGNQRAWRLVVDSLSRPAASFPSEGVKFSVILTISDPKKTSDVFNEVRRSLISQGVNIADIRTANRLQSRN